MFVNVLLLFKPFHGVFDIGTRNVSFFQGSAYFPFGLPGEDRAECFTRIRRCRWIGGMFGFDAAVTASKIKLNH
jgi:hypothetical protein